nr:integrase core domain-containing protein [Frankia sp. Cj5]
MNPAEKKRCHTGTVAARAPHQAAPPTPDASGRSRTAAGPGCRRAAGPPASARCAPSCSPATAGRPSSRRGYRRHRASDGRRPPRRPSRSPACQAPRANTFAECWVRTVRAECLDWTLIWNRRRAEQVLSIYVEHHNTARPHHRLALDMPDRPASAGDPSGPIRRVDRLGGLLHEYQRVA